MGKGTKRWGAAGVVGLLLAIVVIGLGVALWLKSRPAPRQAANEELPQEVDDQWRGFAVAMPGSESEPPPAPAPTGAPAPANEGTGWLGPTITREQMDLALEGWRQAILDKNAENVVSLDRVFTLLPGRYGPQLEKLSQEDADERVRAFSLRTLGKMKNVEMAGLYKKLLADDKSPFVRQNAAWALGELFTVPRGRAAIEGATGELRQAEGSDPAPDVRAAATKTLQKLQ